MRRVLPDGVSLADLDAAAIGAGGRRVYDLPRGFTKSRLVAWVLPGEVDWIYLEHHALGVRGMAAGAPPFPSSTRDDLVEAVRTGGPAARNAAIRGLAFVLEGQWDTDLEPLLLPLALDPDPAVRLPVRQAAHYARWTALEALWTPPPERKRRKR